MFPRRMELRAEAIKTALVPLSTAFKAGNDDKFDIVFVVTLPPPLHPNRRISNLRTVYRGRQLCSFANLRTILLYETSEPRNIRSVLKCPKVGRTVFEKVRRGRGLNPQDPCRESADPKSAGLDHMPNLSDTQRASDRGLGHRYLRVRGGLRGWTS